MRISGPQRERVMGRNFGSRILGIDSVFAAVNNEVADAVLHVRGGIGRSDQPLGTGFILREEKRRRTFRVKEALTEIAMRERDDPAGFILRAILTKGGAGDILPPRPVIAKPEGGRIWSVAGSGPRL